MDAQVRKPQDGSYSGLVTLVFTKCENKMPASSRSSDEHGPDRTTRISVF